MNDKFTRRVKATTLLHRKVMEMYVYWNNLINEHEKRGDETLTVEMFMQHPGAPSRVIFHDESGPEHGTISITANWDEGGDAQITAFTECTDVYHKDLLPEGQRHGLRIKHIVVAFDTGVWTIYSTDLDDQKAGYVMNDGTVLSERDWISPEVNW